jgi:hypothetical protein
MLYARMLLSNMVTLGIGSILTEFASESQTEIPVSDYFGEVLTAGGLIVLPMVAVVASGLGLARNALAAGLVELYCLG